MAIVKMSKVSIAGFKDDSDKIIETLIRCRFFEIRESSLDVPRKDNSKESSLLNQKQAKAAFAINYIVNQNEKYAQEKIKPDLGAGFVPVKHEAGRADITPDEFFRINEKESDLIKMIDDIEKISTRQEEITHERKEIAAFIKAFNEAFPENFAADIDPLTGYDLFTKKKNELMADYLSRNKNAGISDKTDKTVNSEISLSDALEAGQKREAQLKKEAESLFAESLKHSDRLHDLKVLHDYYGVLIEKLNSNIVYTEYAVIVEGWCPTEKAEQIKKQLEEAVPCVCFELTTPGKNDTVPVLLKNKKLVRPFEDITAMYTTPDYKDRDPNFFMSIWFFFMFGIMAGDVVYGFVIFFSTLLLLKLKKMESGLTQLVKVFCICGVSSMIWGTVFGSFLGFGIEVSKDFAFGYNVISNGTVTRYLGWFNPMEQPVKLLGLSLIVGLAQLLFAFCLKAYFLIKDKNLLSALFDVGFNILIIIAVIMFSLNVFAYVFKTGNLVLDAQVLPKNISSILTNTAAVLLLISVAGMFIFPGRKSLKKLKIGSWLGAGLNGIYGGVIGFVADLLSYSRLFGLGLAGGAIAFAFNTLVQTMFFTNGVIMTIIGVIIMVVMHIFNLALALLGTYVHNARLQFLEYYGKFLSGDGRPFKPMGNGTKFVKIK